MIAHPILALDVYGHAWMVDYSAEEKSYRMDPTAAPRVP
jgi:superoxide dismutase